MVTAVVPISGNQASFPWLQIRKAYKKCSLRFHPDKAVAYCKFAPALGSCGAVLADRLEIETRVREEANWLFKCISEANLVLSDQQKRLELNTALDFEERRMFYRNDLYTPPGGSYSFQKPRPAPANPRPSAYARPSARCDVHIQLQLEICYSCEVPAVCFETRTGRVHVQNVVYG